MGSGGSRRVPTATAPGSDLEERDSSGDIDLGGAVVEIMYGLLNLAIPLGVIGGIVAGVVAWRRREGLEAEAEEDRGIGTVKRLYFYAATLAYMIVAGVGIVLVARHVLNEQFGPPVLSRGTGQLALGVALALVGTAIWTGHR